MTTLRQLADGKTIMAYGTSEGVSKAWDTRGRGRKVKPTSRTKGRVGPSSSIRILPVDDPPFTESWAKEHGYPVEVSDGKKASGKKLLNEYRKFGDELVKAHGKLEKIEDVQSVWARFLHFMKSLADWHDAAKNVAEFVAEVAGVVYIAGKVAHAESIHHALQTGYHAIAPVIGAMNHLLASTGVSHSGMFGSSDLRSYVDGKSFMAYGISEGD